MFYRYANNDTQEIVSAPSLRTVYAIARSDRRFALRNGYACSKATIDLIEGDYASTSPFSPAIRVVCVFPANEAAAEVPADLS